ncbi:MAG: trypsin-like serine protease [Thermoanaerobaculales bacterium]|nr:trypsin-like serine protease [Thermoanaerobaculales bacterium]
MSFLRYVCCFAALGLFAFPCAQPARAADNEEKEMEQIRIEELLKQAKPAPTRPGRVYPPEVSTSPAQREIISYDLVTHEVKVLPAGSLQPPFELPPDPQFMGHAVPLTIEEVENGSGLAKITPTRPEPLYNTHSFPWSSIFKLFMRFEVDGEDYWYGCSAATAGAFHLVTAGHCIYNWDPNDDDDESDAKWADEIRAYAGQTDMIDPIGVADRPYGRTMGVHSRTYTGWTNDHNYDHDWGVVTLNRPIGDHVGWMGRETSTQDSLNFSGYPTETPYVPEDTLVQYPGFDNDNVTEYTNARIRLDAYAYGGHSGGPVWRYESTGGDRWITGVNSTSNREGRATACLLTSGKRTDLNSWISSDEGTRAPVSRPELVEYVRRPDEVVKDLHDNQVEPGGSVDLTYNCYNAGHADTDTITIDFYLSTNDFISTSDTKIATSTLSSLEPRYYYEPTKSLTIPAGTAPGTYYVGWIMNCTTQEYVEGDSAVISAETLVVGTSCTPPSTPSGLRSSSSSASIAYAIVEVTTFGGKIWSYASMIDGDSGDPTTIPVVNLG